MIYVIYQGTGKSTLARNNVEYIDLESSMFWLHGKRIDEWEKVYVNIAKDLSEQGKNVFLSSHKEVRKYLNDQNIEFITIYPALELKDKWIEKLENRYKLFPTDKNLRAFNYAKEHYEENIKDLFKEKFVIEIIDINYDLEKILKRYNNV